MLVDIHHVVRTLNYITEHKHYFCLSTYLHFLPQRCSITISLYKYIILLTMYRTALAYIIIHIIYNLLGRKFQD